MQYVPQTEANTNNINLNNHLSNSTASLIRYRRKVLATAKRKQQLTVVHDAFGIFIALVLAYLLLVLPSSL